MILTTHITAAATVAAATDVTDPFIAFFIGIGSHYILDAIPHWEYALASVGNRRGKAGKRTLTLKKRLLAKDLFRIALDGILGVSLLILAPSFGLTDIFSPLFLSIVIGSTLPDALQPLGLLLKRPPFSTIHDIGQTIHSKKFLPALPWGISTQAAIIAISLFLLFK